MVYRPTQIDEDSPPASMSSLEWVVYRELKRRNIPFSMQVDYAGGVGYRGGMKVDFVLQDRRIVIRVMGFWHGFPGARERDIQSRSYLEALGYTVIDLTTQEIELDVVAALDRKLGLPIAMRGL